MTLDKIEYPPFAKRFSSGKRLIASIHNIFFFTFVAFVSLGKKGRSY